VGVKGSVYEGLARCFGTDRTMATGVPGMVRGTCEPASQVPQNMMNVLDAAAIHAARYLETLSSRPIAPTASVGDL
jgi:hypothetical protein